jgi:hypothetical protein
MARFDDVTHAMLHHLQALQSADMDAIRKSVASSLGSSRPTTTLPDDSEASSQMEAIDDNAENDDNDDSGTPSVGAGDESRSHLGSTSTYSTIKMFMLRDPADSIVL